MNYSGIISNADSLKKTSAFRVTVDENVKSLLYNINSVIIDAHSIGLSKISYKLPINFNITDENVSNTQIQTNVYYKIINELEKLNYIVSLDFNENYTLLVIEWTVKSNKSDLQNMKEKLLSLSIRK